MAEFQEVIYQNKRMCQSVSCCKCDIYRFCGEDLSKCQQFIKNNPKKAEEVIMSWAAEHPEPVYPTWSEWLVQIGVFPQMMSTNPIKAMEVISTSVCKPIPADIAEKLGIEPKEGSMSNWTKREPKVEPMADAIYPTWRKLLNGIGVDIRCDGTVQFRLLSADKPIPADIAEKLGVEPK